MFANYLCNTAVTNMTVSPVLSLGSQWGSQSMEVGQKHSTTIT